MSGKPDEQLEEIRRLLASYVREPRRRHSVSTATAPCSWHPTTVVSPTSGMPFTQAGAWEYVADCLTGGCEITEIVLEKPPGKRGFVMKAALGARELYIKLQLGNGCVIGRSFHYSEGPDE